VAAVALATLALGCSESKGDREAFCATATQLGESSLLDPDATQEQLDRLATVYEQLDETAPSAVRDDVDLLDDTVQKLRTGDISFVADEEKAREVSDALDSLMDSVREECP